MNVEPTRTLQAQQFHEGCRVLRNRATWKHLDLNEPRAGLGVGIILNVGWFGLPPGSGPFNSATVRWGDVCYPNRLDDLLLAPEGFTDDRDYSNPAVLWQAFVEEWERGYGSPLGPIFLDELRSNYERRQAARAVGGR